MIRLMLAILILAGCSGHAAAPQKLQVKPPVPQVAPVVQPAQTIIGRRVIAGELLAPGRTSVYAGDILLGYLVRDPELFSDLRAPGDTGISATVSIDAGGTRYWTAVGDLDWAVKQAFGTDAPWTVVVMGGG